MGLTGISPTDVPSGAVQAAKPQPHAGEITGVVWRDFKPGGGKTGVVEKGELGLPGVAVELQQGGKTVQSATTEDNGTFSVTDVIVVTYTSVICATIFSNTIGYYLMS